MTKDEYNKITELLNKEKQYNNMINVLERANVCTIIGKDAHTKVDYWVEINNQDREEILSYFYKQLNNVSKQLKELEQCQN